MRRGLCGAALGLSLLLSGCGEALQQGCDADEAAKVIAEDLIDQIASNPFGGLVAQLADAFLPLAGKAQAGATVSGFTEATDFEFRDVVALKQDSSTAVCSGALYHKEQGDWVSLGAEFTWRVDQTEDGRNLYQWQEGRLNPSAFD